MIRQYILFNIDDKIYGLDIMQVESIERMTSITKVPNTPSYVLGVINLRSEIVPVISFRDRFNMQNKAYDDATRIIITHFEDYRVGIIVDQVKEVFDADIDTIQPTDSILNDKRPFIQGVIYHNKDIIMILNIQNILDINI